MTEQAQTDLNKPIETDQYTTKLYEELGLGKTPSLEQVEVKATELLENPLTMLNGAALVMGREVMADEKKIVESIMVPSMTGKDRFGTLLMQKSIEQMSKVAPKVGK